MSENNNFGKLFKQLTGKDLKPVTRVPTVDESIKQLWKQSKSNQSLRVLGQGTEGLFTLTEEEINFHTHIIGTTQQGKSYFIQHLIREDIDKGIGVCYLDPTGLGKNAKAILKYCAYKNHKKVCVIDYSDHFRRGHAGVIPGINPFYRKFDKELGWKPQYKSASVNKAVDSMMVLYNVRDQADVGRVSYYLPAVFSCIAQADGTLYDSVYFMERDNPLYEMKRGEILDASSVFDTQRIALESVFNNKSPQKWNEFITTARRFGTIVNQETLRLMFGAKVGIDFTKMVADGWVILVNLSPTQAFNMMHTRFLGVSIINEILFAMERLYKNDWRGRYNLYIDEVARFANTKLVDTLSNMLQFGLRVTMAHQSFAQIESPYIRDQITQLCDFKVMFHTPSRTDRDKMIRDMYGGDITDRQASYANMNLPRQEAILKAPKGTPERVRIANVLEVPVSDGEVEDYKTELYKQAWYHDPSEVWEDIKQRFKPVKRAYEPKPTQAPPIREEPRKKTVDKTPPRVRSTHDDPPARLPDVPPAKSKFSGWNTRTSKSGTSSKTPTPNGEGQGDKTPKD